MTAALGLALVLAASGASPTPERQALEAAARAGQAPEATTAEQTAARAAAEALVDLDLAAGDTSRARTDLALAALLHRELGGHHGAALAASERALDLALASGDAAETASAWAEVARDLSSLGRADEALAALERARDLRPAGALPRLERDLVRAAIAAGDVRRADAEVTAALERAASAPPARRAGLLLALADLYLSEGAASAGVKTLGEALAAAAADGEALEAARVDAAWVLLASLVESVARSAPDEAEALARCAGTDLEELPIDPVPFVERLLRRRRLAGDLDGLLREDDARIEAARGRGDVAGEIEALRSLAATWRAARADDRAAATLEAARTLAEDAFAASPGPPEARDLARTQISLGGIYLRTRQPALARAAYRRALEVASGLADATAHRSLRGLRGEAWLGMARADAADDDPEAAREVLEKAERGELEDAAASRADALRYHARLERDLGERGPDAVLALYDRALAALPAERRRTDTLELGVERARWLASLGPRPEGPAAAAARAALPGELALLEAEAAARRDARSAWRIPYLAGRLAEGDGRAAQALASYLEAAGRLDRLRDRLGLDEGRRALGGEDDVRDLDRRLIALLLAAGREREAFERIERGKARTLLEQRGTTRGRPEGGRRGALDRLEREVFDLRLALDGEHGDALRGSGHDPARLEAELAAAERRLSLELARADLAHSRAGQAGGARPLTLAELSRLLPRRAALVEYALLPAGAVAYVVTRHGHRQVSWPLDLAVALGRVQDLRRRLARPGTADLAPLLADVSAAFLAPVAPLLPPDLELLYLVPAGPLAHLPFAVLPLPDGRALLERTAIATLPSASALAFLGGERKRGSDLFLGALGEQSVEGWPPLPGTLVEVERIAEIVPEARRVAGPDFRRSVVLEALATADVVHLATHGLLDEKAPALGALLMSPAGGEPTRLSVYELAAIEVRSHLVILSACETGLGRLEGGDEVMSLARGFLLSGASAVVASLWQVADEPTARLMAGLHRELRAGRSPARALRTAALELRATHPHPALWAPFVVAAAD